MPTQTLPPSTCCTAPEELSNGGTKQSHSYRLLWPLLAAMCMEMIHVGKKISAVSILLMFIAYLWPGELFDLQRVDLARPMPGSPFYAIHLHPAARQQQSKVGLSDKSLMLDSPLLPWLGVVLQTLATHQTYLIDLTYDKLVKDWKCALMKVGLASNHAVLYQLRHSGPSFDRQQKHRSRWRWSSAAGGVQTPAWRDTRPMRASLKSSTYFPKKFSGDAWSWKKRFQLEAQRLLLLHQLPRSRKRGLWLRSSVVAQGCQRHALRLASCPLPMTWHWVYGSACDLLQPRVLASLLKFIQIHSSEIALVWMGTPCTTWSRARKNDGGPPPLRNGSEWLWGFPNLPARDLEKISQGNALLDCSVQIAQLCSDLQHGSERIPSHRESGWRSHYKPVSWRVPLFSRLIFVHLACLGKNPQVWYFRILILCVKCPNTARHIMDVAVSPDV